MLSKMLASARQSCSSSAAPTAKARRQAAEIAQLKNADANPPEHHKSLMASSAIESFRGTPFTECLSWIKWKGLATRFDFADYLSIAMGEAVTVLVADDQRFVDCARFIFLALYGVAG